MDNGRKISIIAIEITNYCNYSCRFCPQSIWRMYNKPLYNRNKGFISFPLFSKLILEADKIASEVNFGFFGEPMLHPYFCNLIDMLKYRNTKLKFVMNTNLSVANKHIFQTLIDINMTELRISIDAATPATYDTIRPGKYWMDIEGKINIGDRFETICHKMEYWFSLSNHVPTRHVFTVNSKNVGELKQYVEKWLPYLGDSDCILVKNVLTYGGKMQDEMIRPNPCNVWENNMLIVDWAGRVSPCNLDVNMDLEIGDVTTNSLLEISNNHNRHKLERESIKKNIDPCKSCIDANNWTDIFFFKKGDRWTDECYKILKVDN